MSSTKHRSHGGSRWKFTSRDGNFDDFLSGQARRMEKRARRREKFCIPEGER